MAEFKNKNSNLNIFTMTQIAVLSALLCISAYITIPIPLLPIPITLQFFMVVLISLLLKPRQALATQLIYTMLGIIGLPVFSGGKGGLGAILSPSGGFIIGFLIISFLISIFKGNKENIILYSIVSISIGIPISYFCGILSFAIYTNTNILTATAQTVSIFAVLDIVKCILASITAVILKRSLRKANIPF